MALVVCSILLVMLSELVVPGDRRPPAVVLACRDLGGRRGGGLLVAPLGAVAAGRPSWRWWPSPSWRWDSTWSFADRNGFNYSVTFVLVFALVGLTQPRWTSLRLSPVPGGRLRGSLRGRRPDPCRSVGLGSAIFVVPVCVVLGEAIAWGMHRLADGRGGDRRGRGQRPPALRRGAHRHRQARPRRAVHRGEPGLRRDPRLPAAPRWSGWSVADLTHPDDREDSQGQSSTGCSPGRRTSSSTRSAYLHADGHVVGRRSTARPCGTPRASPCS